MRFIPKVSLHGSGEVVELSNGSHADFTLMQGSSGLGMRPQEISTVALPSGGSLVQHRRGSEHEVQLPILLGGSERKRWDLRRKLERLARGQVEIRVTRSNGVYRSRFGYYKSGLEGMYGAGEDSPNGQKLVLEFLCPGEYWNGEEQGPEFRLTGLRKRFLSETGRAGDEGIVQYRSRRPAQSDFGLAGDLWLVGQLPDDWPELERVNLAQNSEFTSLSNQVGTGNIFAGGGGTVEISDDWSLSGGTSLKLGTTGSGWGAAYQGDFPAQGGETFTVSATVHLTETLAGTLNGEALRIVISYKRANGSGVNEWVHSVQAPNEPGTTTLRVTFTLPDDAASWVARLFHGAESGPPVYWDDFRVYEELGSVPSEQFHIEERFKHDGSRWANVGMVSPFLPIVLASSTVQGEFEINIGGDAPAYPTWIVDGPGSDLIIENDKGQSIKVLTEIEDQVTITTNPLRQDITSPMKPDGELWEHVPTTSVFFGLEPGTQTVKMSMVGAKPNSLVRCLYRENYWAGW